jgi:lipopolysaccharide export system permease protein
LALDKDSTLNVFVDFAKNEFSFLKLYEDTLGETHKPDVQVSSKRLADSLQKIVLAQEQEELIAQQKKDPEPVKPQNESKIHSKFSTAKINKELLAKRLQKNVITAEVSQSIVHDQPISKDSVFPLKADFLSNFDSLDQVRMVAGAFSLARNAAYQSTAILKRLDVKAKIISKYKVEWHRKFTLSFACIILFFIGAPLGAIIRKGGLGMPLVISILLFVAYHVLTIIGEKSVKSMLMDPFLGMWMSSLIFLPFGVFLTVKATSDAPLMDSEVWYRFVKRINILNRFKKNPKG